MRIYVLDIGNNPIQTFNKIEIDEISYKLIGNLYFEFIYEDLFILSGLYRKTYIENAVIKDDNILYNIGSYKSTKEMYRTFYELYHGYLPLVVVKSRLWDIINTLKVFDDERVKEFFSYKFLCNR